MHLLRLLYACLLCPPKITTKSITIHPVENHTYILRKQSLWLVEGRETAHHTFCQCSCCMWFWHSSKMLLQHLILDQFQVLAVHLISLQHQRASKSDISSQELSTWMPSLFVTKSLTLCICRCYGQWRHFLAAFIVENVWSLIFDV